MKHSTPAAMGAACLLFTTAAAASANEPVDTTHIFEEIITVTGVRENHDDNTLYPEHTSISVPDTAALVARLPGAALIMNGPLSGQVAYRGLFGSRVGIAINGQHFHSGGPNMMDPPLHYAPPVLVDHIRVSRGVPGVAVPGALAGGLDVHLKSVDFGMTDEVLAHYDLTATARSVDDSHAIGGVAGISNDRYRLFARLSSERGGDRDTPLGTLPNTRHDRKVLGLVTGARFGDSEVELAIRQQETGPTGNPPFAMDIEYVDTDFSQLTLRHRFEFSTIEARIAYSDVDHGMNNFELRPVMTNTRRTLTGAQTWTAAIEATFDLDASQVVVGVDSERADKSARITNPDNADFWLESLPTIGVRRTGAFAEWQGSLSRNWDVAVAGRVDTHRANAGIATVGTAVPMMPAMLAGAFNQQPRGWTDVTSDLQARAWHAVGDVTWRASIARRSHAPGYVERFAWLPTPASGGLADGNIWIGNLALAPEVALVVDAGFDWYGDHVWVRPSVFVSNIDDFIQGTPFDATPGVIDSPVEMVANMNGDPTPLQFNNVDARLYGLEADFGMPITHGIALDGSLTVTRGERRDIDDELYRITPDRLMLGLTWTRQAWQLRLEGVHHRDQKRVSLTNSEQATPGYTLANVNLAWEPGEHLQVSLGADNLLDREYRDHLGGYNRVMGSIVPVGERMPGTGRNLYLRLQISR